MSISLQLPHISIDPSNLSGRSIQVLYSKSTNEDLLRFKKMFDPRLSSNSLEPLECRKPIDPCTKLSILSSQVLYANSTLEALE